VAPLSIVYLDSATIPSHITIPTPSFPHHWTDHPQTSAEQLDERLTGQHIVITNKVVLDAAILEKHPQIKLIAISATGTNNVDLSYCKQQGIRVCNIQGYATRSVPEHVIAMMFALRRNLRGYQQDIEQGEWQRQNQFCFFTHPIQDIEGRQLGIIGSGALGQALAVKAQALGMNVVFSDRKGASSLRPGYQDFETVLRESDVISLNCPLNSDTKNLISSTELSMMKSSSVLINTARGGVVDEQALVDALNKKQISAAASDVFIEEPAPQDNPLMLNAHLPNLILTPHVAWGSDSAITKLVRILIDNLNAFVDGEPTNVVI
jgi:glycerate dehydrogenase